MNRRNFVLGAGAALAASVLPLGISQLDAAPNTSEIVLGDSPSLAHIPDGKLISLVPLDSPEFQYGGFLVESGHWRFDESFGFHPETYVHVYPIDHWFGDTSKGLDYVHFIATGLDFAWLDAKHSVNVLSYNMYRTPTPIHQLWEHYYNSIVCAGYVYSEIMKGNIKVENDWTSTVLVSKNLGPFRYAVHG